MELSSMTRSVSETGTVQVCLLIRGFRVQAETLRKWEERLMKLEGATTKEFAWGRGCRDYGLKLAKHGRSVISK